MPTTVAATPHGTHTARLHGFRGPGCIRIMHGQNNTHDMHGLRTCTTNTSGVATATVTAATACTTRGTAMVPAVDSDIMLP